MDIIVSLFTTYFLYRTLFSAPIDAPSSLYNRITDGDLTSPDCSTLKEAFINFASFLVGFIIIGAIQSLLMNNFAPQRSEVLDEISITVLSGQEFNVFFTLLRLIGAGLFGALSLSTIIATSLINVLYLILMTILFKEMGVATNSVIPILEPFERPIVLAVTLLILFIYSMVTYDPNLSAVQTIFKCVWEFVDKVHLQSCLSTCIACTVTNDVAKAVILATGHSTHLHRLDGF